MVGSLTSLLALLVSSHVASAATAEQWKTRSIYQLFTDRFAPPSSTAPARTSPLPTNCEAGLQTWCGGTWLSIIDKLDYIQGMGFDSIWISPTSENLDVWTPYNYAYHGYWVTDPRKINLRFGSADDLKALSKALHDRGMYLMVDVVVNNVPALHGSDSRSADALRAGGLIWDSPDYFHDQCWIDYNNQTSVEYCWMGDDNLALMDVKTEHPHVISTLEDWIVDYVKEFSIDGLRIDAAKHVPGAFWTSFCGKAGVFCMGEVYGDDLPFAARFQTERWLDSILGFPYYYGLVRGFGQPFGNMSGYVDTFNRVMQAFPNPDYLGNFIENHDLPRWRNQTVDQQLGWNAMVAQYIYNGIPTVYYGQEQDFSHGAGDPFNRAALWPSNYANTTTYNRIARLNTVRHSLITNTTTFNGTNFMNAKARIVQSSEYDVAIRRGPALAVLTNRGSPSSDAGFAIPNSGWPGMTNIIDVLSCRSFAVSSGGTVSVSYAAPGQGGMPYLFMAATDVNTLRLCDKVGIGQAANSTATAPQSGAGVGVGAPSAMGYAGVGVLLGLGAYGLGF